MIETDAIEAFNRRLTVDLNSIKTMTPAQLDRVKEQGSQAENLLRNKDFAYFVHTFKFERMDALTVINAHDLNSNNERVAVSNQLTGIDEFIRSLKRAVYFRNKVVSQQTGQLTPEDPAV